MAHKQCRRRHTVAMAAIFQQVLCAIATMVKRTLHEDGTDHQTSCIDCWGRSWKGDTDASWKTKERAVGVGGALDGRGSAGRQLRAFLMCTKKDLDGNDHGRPAHCVWHRLWSLYMSLQTSVKVTEK